MPAPLRRGARARARLGLDPAIQLSSQRTEPSHVLRTSTTCYAHTRSGTPVRDGSRWQAPGSGQMSTRTCTCTGLPYTSPSRGAESEFRVDILLLRFLQSLSTSLPFPTALRSSIGGPRFPSLQLPPSHSPPRPALSFFFLPATGHRERRIKNSTATTTLQFLEGPSPTHGPLKGAARTGRPRLLPHWRCAALPRPSLSPF